MFELTTCTAIGRTGRDCLAKAAPEAPIPLCLKHMREAYLYFSEYLRGLPKPTETDWLDLAKSGSRDVVLKDRDSVVYYAQIGYHIKIGTTRDLKNRMSQLMPDQLLATESGGRDLEKRRLRQFEHLLSKGNEYFDPGPELLEHVEKLRTAGVA